MIYVFAQSYISRDIIFNLQVSLVFVVGGDDRCAVRGAFASQYVAHHLQAREGPSSNQLTEGGGEVSNTKNLANLSRLFRQLKPLHTEPGRMKLVVSDDSANLFTRPKFTI